VDSDASYLELKNDIEAFRRNPGDEKMSMPDD
jgi:hypothetical protein